MSKSQKLTRLVSIMVNNWIVTGDQPDSRRSTCERQLKNTYAKCSEREIDAMLNGITIL